MDRDQIVVVQETEYTGAGKHHNSQLSFARSRGIEVRRGDPAGNIPGKAIVLPERLDQVGTRALDLDKLRRSYLRHASQVMPPDKWGDAELEFLADETNPTTDAVRQIGADLAKEGASTDCSTAAHCPRQWHRRNPRKESRHDHPRPVPPPQARSGTRAARPHGLAA